MDLESRLKLISEGTTQFWTVENDLIPDNKRAGPGNASVPVFYNPSMEFNRDLSIMVIEEFLAEKGREEKKQVNIIDGLAGTGVRGVRFENEVKMANEFETTIIINDHNPLAYNLIKKNIEFNHLILAQASKNDLNAIFGKDRFDYIDIDPFGSPIKFIDSATRVLKNRGILAVTATDTATLFGAHPKTCLRRYDAHSCRTDFSHELGIRILLGSVVRIGAHHNIGLRPLLVFSTDHYYRLYLRCSQGRNKADWSLKNIGFVLKAEKSSQYRVTTREEMYSNNLTIEDSSREEIKKEDKPKWRVAGPLWLGELYEVEFIKMLKIGTHKFGTKNQIMKMLSVWLQEASAPVGFYKANSVASELKSSTPPLQEILKYLKAEGFTAVRTHFDANAFKTDAPFEVVCSAIKK